MPEIGEIRKPKEIGYKGRTKYIWYACLGCGKEQWARLRRGEPIWERCPSCAGRARGLWGEKNPAWKGGRNKNGYGYVRVKLYTDDFFHPMRSKSGYVLEHRLVMAKHLGRCLHKWEVVHHRNGIRDDNRIENLQIVQEMQHKQVTIIGNRIISLERQVARLKDENQKLKVEMGKLRKR
ncbi:MAG: hypothetical protein DDT26_02768 [Dehalococcoidia bacterium]|nr:hypothetical protein [Chloroflexota bacterium]